jgi:B12 binding domain
MLFAYLSDSDSVNVTSVYEMYPIGWFSIRQRLADCGFDAKIVNVASLMLMYPDLDVRRLLSRLEAPIFGFDLHWMTQCHGAIELAAVLKQEHPDALTVFGGISATYSGCAHDCGWCGGSRFAYRNIMGVRKTLIQKDNDLIVDELHTMKEAAEHTSIYALQCYSGNKTRMNQYLDAVRELGYRSVSFEQFNLTPQDTLQKMGESTDAYIRLSPESHDPKISAAAGRDTYTMTEMKDWIPRALDAGVKGIMVWFFIGMPYQDRQSVLDTVSYSERLIRKFGGWKALPLICPMVPFLDPGSRFFAEPAQHGYRIFHRTLEEHRQAMVEPLWHRRLNYETRWLDRRQLQDVSYEAIARLAEVKGEHGVLPSAFCQAIRATIDETRRMLGGRWFDDATVPQQMIEDCLTSRPSPASLAAT